MWSSIQFVSVLGSLLLLVAYVARQFGWLSAKSLAFALITSVRISLGAIAKLVFKPPYVYGQGRYHVAGRNRTGAEYSWCTDGWSDAEEVLARSVWGGV
jgi:hypothetical protein